MLGTRIFRVLEQHLFMLMSMSSGIAAVMKLQYPTLFRLMAASADEATKFLSSVYQSSHALKLCYITSEVDVDIQKCLRMNGNTVHELCHLN